MDYIEANAQPIQIPLGDFLEMRDELIKLRKLKEEKGEYSKEPEPLIGDRVQKIIDETIRSKEREQLIIDSKVALKKAIHELIKAQLDFEKFRDLPYFEGVALVDLYDMLVTVSSKGDRIDIKSYRDKEIDKELLTEVGDQLLNKKYKVRIKPLYSLEEDKVFCYKS